MKIKKMPTKKALEGFLNGLEGKVTVFFNSDKGHFERIKSKDT